MADSKREEDLLDNERRDSETVSRDSLNLAQEAKRGANGQDDTGEDVQREGSFSRKKKGKGRAKRQEATEEAVDREESFSGPQKGKKKGKGGKKGKKARRPSADESKQSVPSEQIIEETSAKVEADISITGDKEKMDVIENVDNKLIQEAQETEQITPKEGLTIQDSDKNKDGHVRESSEDEKKDSEKESASDEDNTTTSVAKGENTNASDKSDDVKDGKEGEIRRRPTLSELRGTSVEGEQDQDQTEANEVSERFIYNFS
jgi:hypothetical protein